MTVTIKTQDNEREFESKNDDFEDMKELLDQQNVDYEIENGDSVRGATPVDVDENSERGGQADSNDVRVADTTEGTKSHETAVNASEQLPQEPSVSDDPVDWLPDHFIDHIQGVPTVNRKGYAVIASKYNFSVTADPVIRASESDHEFAEFKAIAVTEDGQEYSGFGSAHVNRDNGDSAYLLNELAETRAMKRAVSWATGIGMTAIEELKGQ